jgi:hypothetical protein
MLTGMTTVKAPPFREIIPDTGELKVNLHEGQARVWRSTKRFIIMSGSTQVGKTCLGPHWLEREIYGDAEYSGRGPGDYLAVTATFPLLKLKMLPEFLYVFRDLQHLGSWREGDRVFTSHDRHHGAEAWRVIFGSAANPESIESATAQAAWLDELGQHQFRRESWDAVVRRLTLAQGRVLGTTTLYELGWLKTELYDRWRGGDESIDWIEVDALVNPVFPKEEYERARRVLPLWKFRMFYQGKYDRPAGLIYDSFDETTCKIKRFEIPKEWPRYVGHDFGPNNTAAIWYAHDPSTGYLYVYRCYHAGGLSAFDHAQKFKALSGLGGELPGENIIKRTGGSQTEDGWRESFTAAGWPISKPRIREVEVGINRVYGWHQQNKLFVFDDVGEYLDEKLSYSRKLDDNYEATKEIDDKSKFHLMDAERYLISDFAPETVMGSQVVRVQKVGAQR